MAISHSVRATAAVLVAIPALAGSASAAQRGPTAAEIRAAVKTATHSQYLWATVNVCNVPSTHPAGNKLIGVRIQMPALGFTTRLYMAIRIDYWSYADQRFKPTGSSLPATFFSRATHGVHQSGAAFPIVPPPRGARYLLRGVATLQWRLGGKVIGRVVRKTGHGFQHVDFSRPPGYNAGTCTITH